MLDYTRIMLIWRRYYPSKHQSPHNMPNQFSIIRLKTCKKTVRTAQGLLLSLALVCVWSEMSVTRHNKVRHSFRVRRYVSSLASKARGIPHVFQVKINRAKLPINSEMAQLSLLVNSPGKVLNTRPWDNRHKAVGLEFQRCFTSANTYSWH